MFKILMHSIRKINDKKFDISYTSKEITQWARMIFLKQMLRKIGFRKQITKYEDLPQPKSNRGHQVTGIIIEVFVSSIYSFFFIVFVMCFAVVAVPIDLCIQKLLAMI
jgi:hypothetical protein